MSLPRLYVSGPMRGYEEFNFPAFHAAAADLRAAGFEVCNPAEVMLACGCQAGTFCGSEFKHEWQEYLRADLRAMLDGADAVATLSGWERSKGARLEVHVARQLWWDVRPVDEWIAAAREQLAG